MLDRPQPDAIIRLLRFVLSRVTVAGVDVSLLDAHVATLATWESDKSAAVSVIRALKPAFKRFRHTDGAAGYCMCMVFRAAQTMNHGESIYDQLNNAAQQALWAIGHAGHADVGSGRVCHATVRAVLAGVETP